MTLDTNTVTNTQQFDRVRNHTSDQVNEQIDQKIEAQVQQYINQPAAISQHLQELGQEWDTERVLEANASVLAFTGLLLGLFVNSYWFWLPAIVLPFLFQHAIQGWCPPLPVIRRLGVRTRNEIDQEKYALKVLRGDFDRIASDDQQAAMEASTILQAIKR